MKINEKIFIILCFISFIQPNFFVKVPFLNTMSIFVAVLCLLVLLLRISKKVIKIDSTFLLLILWRIMILFPTIRNGGEIIKWGYQSVVFIGLYLLIINYVKNKNAFKLIYKMLFVYVLINIFLILIYPNGIFPEYGIYFLGIRTRFTEFSIALIYMAIVYYMEFSDRKFNDKFILVLSILFAILNITIKWVATGIVTIFASLLMYLFLRKCKKLKGIYKFCFIFLLIFTVLLINGSILGLFNNLFVALNKDITLTGRTLIWENALPMLKNHFFFGYGYVNDGNIIRYHNGLWQAHNTVIQSICECGIFGTISLFTMMYKQGKPSNSVKKQKLNSLNISIVLTYLIMMMTEIVYYYPIFIFILLLIGNTKKEVIE